MKAAKKIGIILSLLGLCLPLLTLGFIDLFSIYPPTEPPQNLFLTVITNLQHMEVFILVKAVPYRYFYSLGVLLFFTGVAFIALSGGDKKR